MEELCEESVKLGAVDNVTIAGLLAYCEKVCSPVKIVKKHFSRLKFLRGL